MTLKTKSASGRNISNLHLVDGGRGCRHRYISLGLVLFLHALRIIEGEEYWNQNGVRGYETFGILEMDGGGMR